MSPREGNERNVRGVWQSAVVSPRAQHIAVFSYRLSEHEMLTQMSEWFQFGAIIGCQERGARTGTTEDAAVDVNGIKYSRPSMEDEEKEKKQ